MKRNKYSRMVTVIVLFFIIGSQISCKKYLEKKKYQNMAIPSSLSDLQAVLDNQQANGSSPGYMEFVADNYYLTTTVWMGLPVDERTNYIWDKNEITSYNTSWSWSYAAIYNCNFVLDLLPKISFTGSELNAYNNIKGTALFYRAFMFHQLAQLFCKPFSGSAGTDTGIILRMTSDINAQSVRSTVQQTYDQVINDLKTATQLLPLTNVTSMRPNKAAAYAGLARVYLSMRDYNNAGLYADSCLKLNNVLLDYNSLSAMPAFANNPEILFISYEGYMPSTISNPSKCNIDTTLYQLYNVNDLRKTLFFGTNGSVHYWKGSYVPAYGTFTIFDGIATDEVYLIRAECSARAGNKNTAMNDLNTLLSKRCNSTFASLTAIDAADALNKVLAERRKELVCRGLRWSDLRRFNLEGANITLTRIVNNTTYTLPPNDLRWVLLVPDIEIGRSGVSQNPR